MKKELIIFFQKSLAVAILISFPLILKADEGIVSPPMGDPVRKAIADALRIPVEKDLKKKVIFKIEKLNLWKSWAFFYGAPLQPGGKAMDYRGTRYQKAINAEMFDDNICALFHNAKDGWQVVKYEIGRTDSCFGEYERENKIPVNLSQ
jgi:hypothetical protein